VMDLKSILSRVARAGAVTMVVAGCLAGTISADGGGEMPSSHPMLLLNTLGSQNWAGWASFGGTFLLPQPGAVTYVKGEWTVPTLKCASGNGDSSIWVGIDGMANQTVEQIGTEQDCVNGLPVYKAWWETYPNPKTPISMAVKPGDAMRGEVKYVGNGQFELTLANLTTGQSFKTTQSAPGAARSSAEWIVEAPYKDGVLPLANFGSVSFRNAPARSGRSGR